MGRVKQSLIVLISILAACKIPYKAADVFEEKADLYKDEAPHTKNSLEWWYFTGHLFDTSKQKEFGVEYVIFHFNPTNVRGGWMLNMAVSDPENDTFYYDHKFFYKPKHQFEKLPLNMHWDKGKMSSSFKGVKGSYQIQANMDKHSVSCNLNTKPAKSAILHDGVGYEQYGDYAKAGYYTYPRLSTLGQIHLNEDTFKVHGELWYDRQWNCSGVWDRKVGWDWFAIQYQETNSDLMLYRLFHIEDSVELFGGSYTDSSGNSVFLNDEDIQITESKYWKSSNSEAKYPIEWEISIPKLDLKSTVNVAFEEQELELKYGLMPSFYYWEGMSYARGSIKGKSVKANAYVEMTNRFRLKE